MRCKPAGWAGDDERRPGAILAERIAAELAQAPLPEPVAFRTIRCMSQCKRPCVVALSGPDRFTYLFGDLEPESDAAAVVDALQLYLTKPDGFMERSERPRALGAGILGRVPPLGSTHPLVQTAHRRAVGSRHLQPGGIP